MVALVPDEFTAAAIDQTGLDDFGGDSYREGLEILCRSAQADAEPQCALGPVRPMRTGRPADPALEQNRHVGFGDADRMAQPLEHARTGRRLVEGGGDAGGGMQKLKLGHAPQTQRLRRRA